MTKYKKVSFTSLDGIFGLHFVKFELKNPVPHMSLYQLND